MDIIIGLGANLYYGEDSPGATIAKAMDDLCASGINIYAKSARYQTVPVPKTGQPDFTNCVALASTDMAPEVILALFYELELKYGRDRSDNAVRWDARTLDIDLLDCASQVLPGRDGWLALANEGGRRPLQALTLPHPRLHKRAFVLRPLADIAPQWRHPVFGGTTTQLLEQHLKKHPDDVKNVKKLPE